MQFFRCLLLSTWLFASAYRGNYKPFQNWQCVGCVADDTNATASIYRKVHRALRQRGSAREVYLLLDHSWIDRLLESSTVVVIHVIPRDELSDTHMVQQVDIQEEKKVDGMQREERYVVVYSPPAAHRRMVLRKVEALMIDTFLLKNPCFLPLHDPPVTLNDSQLLYPLGPPSRRLSTDGSMIRSMRETRVYELTAIFVRLPSYPYHATCKLYSLVTSRQFPTRCPASTDIEALEAYWLGNIGWVNNVYPLVTKLQSSLHNDRVLITPRAQDNGNEQTTMKKLYYRSPMYKSKEGQEEMIRRMKGKHAEIGNALYWEKLSMQVEPSDSVLSWVMGTWGAWADGKECPSLPHFAFDPWSCHFMSLSSCNIIPDMQMVKPREGYADDPTAGSTYLTAMKAIQTDRKTYADGLQLKHLWEYSRFLTFIHRPNIFTRANLRNAIASLSTVSTSSSSSKRSFRSSKKNKKKQIAADAGASSSTAAASVDLTRSDFSRVSSMESCIGVHIRHGDSINDKRGQEKLDRSLSAHVSCAQRLMRDIGATGIYLATDNNTLFSLAPRDHPKIAWYAQHRALKDYTGANFDHRSEKSANREVANLLADMVLLTRCQGMVATYDGGLAHMYLLLSCARRSSGACPPNLDMYKCQPEAKVNSTLYNFSEDPWLNVL